MCTTCTRVFLIADVLIVALTLAFHLDTLRNVSAGHLAVLIPKGIEAFPENNEKMSGTIDVWWIVRILLRSISHKF